MNGSAPYRPPQRRNRGRGTGRMERGSISMDSLHVSGNRQQHFGSHNRRRENSGDRKSSWQHQPQSREGLNRQEQQHSFKVERWQHGSRGGEIDASWNSGGSKGRRNQRREHPISNKELQNLTKLQPDLVVYELLSDKSGFPQLIEEAKFTAYKMDLTVEVLARVTTTQSNRHIMYKLLRKTCTDTFISCLMNHMLQLKRECPQKAVTFFTQLYTILDTSATAMTSLAIQSQINLVDSCHIALLSLATDGHMNDQLPAKYKMLLHFLTEEKKKWQQEAVPDSQARKRQAMLDEMEPPDDFRELSVVPTQRDIVDTTRPFLRKNIVSGHYQNGHHYLDVQFRLLREDFMQPLRLGITQFHLDPRRRAQDIRIYRNVNYVGCRVERRRVFHELHLEIARWMSLNNSRRLLYGNLVCLSSDNFATMVLGAVVDRNNLKDGIIKVELECETEELDICAHYTMVESRAYFLMYKHILQALKDTPDTVPMEAYVVHVTPHINPPSYLTPGNTTYDLRVMRSSSLMKKCQAIMTLFLDRYHRDPDSDHNNEDNSNDNFNTLEMRRLRVVDVALPLDNWPLETELGLDGSQRRALHSALTQELAIIQGPPGTGKTFIGLKLVQALLHNNQVWKTKDNSTPILVVCFTNHALDQFLEGMTAFTQSIVRVGSRTRSNTISQFQINKLVQHVVNSRTLPQNMHKIKMDINNELQDLEEKIWQCDEVNAECEAARGIFQLSIFPDTIIPAIIREQLQQVSDVMKLTRWLTHNHHILTTSSAGPHHPCQGRDKQKWPDVKDDTNTDEDEMKDAEELMESEERDRRLDDNMDEPLTTHTHINIFEVTKEGLEQTLETLAKTYDQGDGNAALKFMIVRGQLEAISLGLAIGVEAETVEAVEAKPSLNIWQLPPHLRWQLYNHWVAKLQQRIRTRRSNLTAALRSKIKACEGIRNAEYLHVMRRAAIVGMTTTGAAQYNSVLRDLAPAIVVIEEAAEILESHVITSLTASCQHLIMIGDHQQLQPSTTVYELATKYGLETSLFERLIKNGLAYETLEYQHRMRPEISKLLVPSIYPSLKDHPSVQEYPRVQGLDHSIFFLTHHHCEREESDDNNSHENQHEAELLMCLCRHLMLQGYEAKRVTILTTYTGQFFLLKKLQRQNPVCSAVHIAVVDNFQGEENDIILLSLVRSNPEGKVGFLRTDNRVCVALSRAKHGLYIIGNMDLLSASSDLWRKVKADLEESGSLGSAFPLRCQNHPHQLINVATANDFLTKSPEGGCQLTCAKQLPHCRHSCPRVCHMDDPEHLEYKCRVPCPKTLCSLEHQCPKLCHEPCGPCMVKLQKLLPCDHTHIIYCHVTPEAFPCPTLLQKLIPACDHLITMPCHHPPDTFPCPKDCDTRLPCGHKCRKKCHRTEDPDHLDYLCMEDCTKINMGCSQEHPCRKKCYQECGTCVEKVDKKLPCGHSTKNVECSQPLEEIKCQKKCKRMLPCGHFCNLLCYEKCGNCQVTVKKPVPACGHTITIMCSQSATTDKCDNRCPKLLPCGHPCLAKCKDPCTSQCPELVLSANTCPKGHSIKLPCHLINKVMGEAAWNYCSAPCGKRLDCQHMCVGTCGGCLQGRLHMDCSEPCKRQLVCGHVCKFPCSTSCPPCQEECQWKCIHSKCRQKCGNPCEPCKEKCGMSCEHKSCKKTCGEKCVWQCKHPDCPSGKKCRSGEACPRNINCPSGNNCPKTKDCPMGKNCPRNKDCPSGKACPKAKACPTGKDCLSENNSSNTPCNEPCRKSLKCGHDCVGFCGDPCPPLCRKCDFTELTELVLLGNEEEPDARFVLLEDCGHCIETEGLEMWLEKSNLEVGMKTCPKCHTNIYNNHRFKNTVLEAYKAVLEVKNKYYKANNNITSRDIQLILQDEEVQYSFKDECFELLRETGIIGLGMKNKHVRFKRMSTLEKALCHFQAQVLKKATVILNQQHPTDMSQPWNRPSTDSKHLATLRPMVKAVVARVMDKTTTITTQMMHEVSCELQRLAVMPAYWTFLEKAAVNHNNNMVLITAKIKAKMDPTIIFDEEQDKSVRALLKESEKFVGGLGISNQERLEILQAMGLRQGHWYKCPKGHIYCITECGNAMMESKCPECGSLIGGASHRLRSDNAVAREMNEAR